MKAEAAGFDDIVASLMKRDSQLELSRLQAEASGDALRVSNVLSDPEAGVEYLRSKSGEQKFNLSVSQSFDWPGVYGARRRQIALEQSGVMLNTEAERIEQRTKYRAALVDIIAANLTIRQMETAVEGCDKLLATLEAEYSRGNVSILDVNKMRIELAGFKLKLAEAKTVREELTGMLLSTATGDVSAIAEQCDSLGRFPLVALGGMEQYMAVAKANDPLLQIAKNQALVAKARRDVAVKGTLPGFSAGYRLSHEGGELFNGFAVGVSVPLWRASKERKAAASEEVSAAFGEKAEEIRLEKRIESVYKKANGLKETISEYGNALTASDNAGLLKRAYESGAITLTELVLDINYFVEAGVQYVELQRQYYNALVELLRYEESVGS
ncbi:MAG: TolC family protein [Muribaculaceae bacterium]|nr:TolC family protein [Muribaculaceae bacterium]